MSDQPRWPAESPGAEALWRGPKGDKGERGEGMTRGARHAVVVLFATIAVLAAAAVAIGAVTAGHLQATQAAQARTERTQAQTVRKLNQTVAKVNRVVHRLRREVRSQCRFDGDLAVSLPVTVNPVTRKASIVVVKFVSDSRVAWHQAGCPGTLPPPSPSFKKWARYYHLPAS